MKYYILGFFLGGMILACLGLEVTVHSFKYIIVAGLIVGAFYLGIKEGEN